ncbi:hypothetical protein DFH06DRAFT_1427525 [Mycena polygramma]|nr:hypothetical protein DFH06DRAFT_1427525 [Mycena polygramma]
MGGASVPNAPDVPVTPAPIIFNRNSRGADHRNVWVTETGWMAGFSVGGANGLVRMDQVGTQPAPINTQTILDKLLDDVRRIEVRLDTALRNNARAERNQLTAASGSTVYMAMRKQFAGDGNVVALALAPEGIPVPPALANTALEPLPATILTSQTLQTPESSP